MIQRIRRWTFSILLVGNLTTLWFAGGCATPQFGPAVAYYAKMSAVTDATARHTAVSPYYRFNSDLLSDLDDAIEWNDVRAQRTMAAAVLRRANALSQASSANEIERMPARVREDLRHLGTSHKVPNDSPESPTYRYAALRAQSGNRHAIETNLSTPVATAPEDTAALQRQFSKLASAALESDLRDVDRLPPHELQKMLRDMRKGVEDLPDDKGRSTRKVLYAWAASATARGIAKEEAKLSEKCAAKAEKKFDRVALWRPTASNQAALIARFAPIIGVEWPTNRRHDSNSDRIGGVKLSAEGQRIAVQIDPTEPTVYTYTTEAKIEGHRFRQLNYVWWYPERPEMTADDPVAGHIDGAMLRITLDANDNPIFVESSLNCGCAHEVFVSDRIESAARQAFGAPLTGKRFSVEKHLPNKHDVVVIHTFSAENNSGHPLVLSAAGYHEVYQIKFDAFESIGELSIVDDRSYVMMDYDSLDHLPLGDGIASMFGPDGLVHYAGRPEGFLLAPSGMLSAGQPRKRGTQRARWDDFLHDDPHLLEKTLRIPPLD